MPEQQGRWEAGTDAGTSFGRAPRARFGRAPGAALRELVADQAGAYRSCESLSTLQAPRHRAAAWRFVLRDGRVVKGRELRDRSVAERVETVLSCVSHPALPRLLARRGHCVLMEWVEGRELEPGPVAARWLHEAADLLATLHTTPPSHAGSLELAEPVSAAASDRHLARLVESGALGPADARELQARLRDLRPANPARGFVHGDLCGENLVVDRTGRLRSIDNEALGIGALDADLARTLYRWGLDGRETATLLDAYSRHRPIASFVEHASYWLLRVCLASAAHRVGAAEEVAGLPLRRLRRILDGENLADL